MIKMKNELIAQTVAPAAKVVTAGPRRNPKMEMGMRWEQASGPRGKCSGHALQTPSTWPALPAAAALVISEEKELKCNRELCPL